MNGLEVKQMSDEHLKVVRYMLLDLKHAMIPQDVEITDAHSKKIDALEFVIKQAEQVQVLEQDKENYRKAMENYKEGCGELERRNDILRSDLTANRNLYEKAAKKNKRYSETIEEVRSYMEQDAIIMMSDEDRFKGINKALIKHYEAIGGNEK